MEPVCFTQFDEAFPKKQGRTLVVGSRLYEGRVDRRAMYDNALGVDMLAGPGVDTVLDMEDLERVVNLGRFDHVDCISVLEHATRPWLLAYNIERVLVPGGTLFVTVPFVWRVHSYPSDYWRFTVEGVKLLFPLIRWHQLTYACRTLVGKSMNIPTKLENDALFFERAEVYGFGERLP